MKISKYLSWTARLGLLLVIISLILYILNLVIFQHHKDTYFYLSIDMAFLPIEVLFVVLVIESVISNREKRILLEKLNMVIGTFFSEMGTELLKDISKYDSNTDAIRQNLIITGEWSKKEFDIAAENIKKYDYQLKISGNEKSIEFLIDLKAFLLDKRSFLLILLENPNLLEHATFTELLRAVFHLTEELDKRNNLKKLSGADYQHLKGDLERVYGL
ncbi:MAG: hypothetical protein LLF83_05555, partial [Methanobacterium sp.]|nr:hypothetical protein [Methanobacterium sp.]